MAGEDAEFLTFTRAIPSRRPRHLPRGIERASESAQRLWEQERFKYGPYQHQEKNLVEERGTLRTLNAEEREVIMGFKRGHTAPAWRRGDRDGHPMDVEDARCALVGNSWCVPVTSWLLGQLLFQTGIVAEPSSPQCCIDGLDYAARLRKQQAEGAESSPSTLAAELLREVNHLGTELKNAPGTSEHPNVWPRRSIDPAWWRWRVVVSTACKPGTGDEHLNLLELRSALTSMRRRARRRLGLGSRFFHFMDSQVGLGALAKARSASLNLQLVMNKLNTTILAAHLRPVWVYINTKVNPADAPSRRRMRIGGRARGALPGISSRNSKATKAWRAPSSQKPS